MNRQSNISQPERWLSVIAGAGLAAYGLTRRSVTGTVLAGVGGMLVWRGAIGHCMIYQTLGISTAVEPEEDRAVSVPYGRGIRVQESVRINATPERLYRCWRNFANLPRIMSHLQSVTVIDEKRSHWVAKGPPGADAEWDAEIINEIPNELIGWRSVNEANVRNAGSVHFVSANGSGTELRVNLRYDPPAGKVGAAIARLFGEDPARQVREDLQEFKQLIESGAIA